MNSTPSETGKLPAIEGWFTMDQAEAQLLGSQCNSCASYFFPGKVSYCRNPDCDSSEFSQAPLSRRGKIWSYTDAQYKPPAPYIAADPFEPFAIAAVELEKEKMIVLGQLAKGVGVDDVTTGMEVELQLQTLYSEDGQDYVSWVWQPLK